MFNSPRFTARHTAFGPRAATFFIRTSRRAFPSSVFGLCMLATVLVGLSGCASSKDKHSYVSTIYRPTTITIKDTVTGEFIWKMDIPVEHELTLDFDSEGETEWASVNADLPATRMKWKLKERRHKKLIDKGDFDMPAPHGTIIQLSLRPAPEKPVALSGTYSPVTTGGEPGPSESVPPVEEAPEATEASEPTTPIDPDSPALLYEPALADGPAPAAETQAAEAVESVEAEMTEAVEAVEVTPSSEPAPAVEEGDPLLDALDLDK